jgi:hypothetical protein
MTQVSGLGHAMPDPCCFSYKSAPHCDFYRSAGGSEVSGEFSQRAPPILTRPNIELLFAMQALVDNLTGEGAWTHG